MHVQPHTPTDITTLKSKVRVEKNAKQRDRYRAVAMAMEGFSTEHIMYILSRSRNFVQRWSYFYRDGGIEAISPRLQTGRPAKLACESAGDFKQRIVAGPTTVDNGLCVLREKDAMLILRLVPGRSQNRPARNINICMDSEGFGSDRCQADRI